VADEPKVTQAAMVERLISSSLLQIALPFPGDLLCRGFKSTALFKNIIVQSALMSFWNVLLHALRAHKARLCIATHDA